LLIWALLKKHLVGTLALLSESEQNRVVGFVINRFRGDISLLQSGLDWLEQETGKPVFGVLPYLHNFHLEAEDAIHASDAEAQSGNTLKVIVPVLPHIANHTDFDALRLHPNVDFQYVKLGDAIPPADWIILPGSKNTIHDLQYLKDFGWAQALTHHLRYGGKVMGICGGFQMLGKRIADPLGVESGQVADGFGWLDMQTTLAPEKQLKQVQGKLSFSGKTVTGYEIHMGESTGAALDAPALKLQAADGARAEGALSNDGQIAGTYVHGLFDHPASCAAWLKWAGLETVEAFDYRDLREQEINRLADELEAHLDWEKLAAYLPD